MTALTDEQIKSAREWAVSIQGCTCPINEARKSYNPISNNCMHCKDWHNKLTDLGVSETPILASNRKPMRSNMRKAA